MIRVYIQAGGPGGSRTRTNQCDGSPGAGNTVVSVVGGATLMTARPGGGGVRSGGCHSTGPTGYSGSVDVVGSALERLATMSGAGSGGGVGSYVSFARTWPMVLCFVIRIPKLPFQRVQVLSLTLATVVWKPLR